MDPLVQEAIDNRPELRDLRLQQSAAELFAKAEAALQAGATGFIFGRNVWQRSPAAANDVIHRLWDLLGRY